MKPSEEYPSLRIINNLLLIIFVASASAMSLMVGVCGCISKSQPGFCTDADHSEALQTSSVFELQVDEADYFNFACQMHGRVRIESGKTAFWVDFAGDQDGYQTLERLNGFLNAAKPATFRIKTNQNNELVAVWPIDENGQAVNFSEDEEDITERKRLEEIDQKLKKLAERFDEQKFSEVPVELEYEEKESQ